MLGTSRVRRGAMWTAAGLAVAALCLVLRQVLIGLFTEWNRWQLASRPELENWIMPGYGVELPATVWALAIVGVGVIVSLVVVTLRRRQT